MHFGNIRSSRSISEVVEASFEITYLTALAKKPHNIGKTLIKPCMRKADSLVLEEVNTKKLLNISLSDSTVKTRIDEIAENIEQQVLETMNKSCASAIQCNETTDIAQMSQ